MVRFELNKGRWRINLERPLKKLEKVLSKEFRKDSAISIAFISSNKSKELNRKYRGKNKAADILTFVYGKSGLAGDIVLCYGKVKERAKKEHKKILETAACLIIHGTCHILGYSHKSNKAALRMEKKERAVLKKIKYARLNFSAALKKQGG